MSKTPKDLEQMQTKLKAKEASLKPLAAKDPKAAGALIAIQKSLKKVGDALVDFGDYTVSQATGSQTRQQKKARDELEKRVTASKGNASGHLDPRRFLRRRQRRQSQEPAQRAIRLAAAGHPPRPRGPRRRPGGDDPPRRSVQEAGQGLQPRRPGHEGDQDRQGSGQLAVRATPRTTWSASTPSARRPAGRSPTAPARPCTRRAAKTTRSSTPPSRCRRESRRSGSSARPSKG